MHRCAAGLRRFLPQGSPTPLPRGSVAPCVWARAATPRLLCAGPEYAAPPGTGPKTEVTIEEAKTMSLNMNECSNDVLLTMAASGNHDACIERLVRNIMAVHNLSWQDAQPKFHEVQYESQRLMYLSKLPYRIGIGTALVAAASTFPLCFDLNTALWFNERFVTADVASPNDLETALEVGAWAWNWMEPPLGQVSFVLLCLQYSRSQMEKIGMKPYTQWWMQKRTDRLCKAFPLYSRWVLGDYATTDFSA